MSKIRTLTKRRAVSPVIATVILVAVTITVAVAVSYWMQGIAGQYTAFEKIEIQSGYAQKSSIAGATPTPGDYKGWKVTLQLQNTGTGEATLSDCFVNDVPLSEYAGEIYWKYATGVEATPEEVMPPTGLTMVSGGKQTLYVYILQENTINIGDETTPIYAYADTAVTFTSGTTVNVKVHSAAGMDYIRLIRLP